MIEMVLSKRAEKLEPSVTLAASAKAKALKDQGIDVLSLTVGEPDFFTPKNIRAAAIDAIEAGKVSFYTPTAGIPELRKAITNYIEAFYGLSYDTNQVIVTDGAKFALYTLFQALLDEADEVIIPVPYWVSYAEQIRLAEGTPVFVEATQQAGFKVTVSQLEAARTNKTKAIILNSPANPTGAIYTKEELLAIGEWAVAHDIWIISDDIYGRLVYNGHEFTPIATLSDGHPQTNDHYQWRVKNLCDDRLAHWVRCRGSKDHRCHDRYCFTGNKQPASGQSICSRGSIDRQSRLYRGHASSF